MYVLSRYNLSNFLSLSKVPKFTLFKFVTLFQSLMQFSNPLVLSIIYQLLLPRHSLLSLSVHVFTPLLFNLHAPHFHPKRHQQIVYSYTTFYQHTLRSTLPLNFFPLLHFASAVVKLLFSLDVFHSLPPNHTNQIAASIT